MPTTTRQRIESVSLPLLQRLNRLPRAVPFLVVLALMVGGIALPGLGWHLAQLRRKLEADPSHPRHFITEPGMGYRFEP